METKEPTREDWLKRIIRPSKWERHQGAKECARRLKRPVKILR